MLNLFYISGQHNQQQRPVATYKLYVNGYIGKLNVCWIIPYYTQYSPKF